MELAQADNKTHYKESGLCTSINRQTHALEQNIQKQIQLHMQISGERDGLIKSVPMKVGWPYAKR